MNNRLCTTLALLALAAVAGCRGDREDAPPREFFPDLDTQLKWTPQGRSEMFEDGRTMRQPPAGAVPFGRRSSLPDAAGASPWASERDRFLKDDPAFFDGVSGRDAAGNPVFIEKLPASITVDKALLLRGQERFNIYCSVCHGYLGDGKGAVGVQYSPAAADLNNPAFLVAGAPQTKDGYIFNIIRHGKPKPDGSGGFTMPPYGHAMSEADSWAIVAYVRALQAARSAPSSTTGGSR